jgi:hypothetical protein
MKRCSVFHETIEMVIFNKGGENMEKKIEWETNLSAATTRAQRENKPVLLDFHNPN